MSAWIGELVAALAAEFGERPRVAALATVDFENRPHARSVICRAIDTAGQIWITSDARSGKNAHIRQNPAVALLFWLPTRREQYRLEGQAVILDRDDLHRADCWRALDDSARAMFSWPDPGSLRTTEPLPFAQRLGREVGPVESFEVIWIRPDRVESLELSQHPHRRRQWRAANNWAGEELNP